MTDAADLAQAQEEVLRATRFRATDGANPGEPCDRCDRPLEPYDRRHNPNATTCTRCRKAGAKSP
ncbi:MAG: hypothetical protein K2X46_12010 [Roseomonas sp.]|nr:hypothetical protein [Roseomonas sp.]